MSENASADQGVQRRHETADTVALIHPMPDSTSLQEALIAPPAILQSFNNDSMSSLQAVASSASSLC